MAATSKLNIVIGASVNGAMAGFRSVAGALGNIVGTVGRIAGIGGGLGLAGVGAAFVASQKSAIAYGEALENLSAKSGVAATELAKIQYAARFENVNPAELANGIRFLQRAMSEAAETAENEYATAFRQAGISTEGIAGRDVLSVFRELSTFVRGSASDATKTGIAMQLLGRSGQDFIPLLKNGATWLDAMGREASRLGLVWDGFAEKADKVDDNITRIKQGILGIGVSALNQWIDQLDQVTERLGGLDFKGIGVALGENLRGIIQSLSALMSPEGRQAWGDVMGKVFDVVVQNLTTALQYGGDYISYKITSALGDTAVGKAWGGLKRMVGIGAGTLGVLSASGGSADVRQDLLNMEKDWNARNIASRPARPDFLGMPSFGQVQAQGQANLDKMTDSTTRSAAAGEELTSVARELQRIFERQETQAALIAAT